MNDILPFGFSDESNKNPNADPSMKITVHNLINYYLQFYRL